MNRLVFALLLLAVRSVGAQPLESWGYPDPEPFTKAIGTLCAEQRDSVVLATRYRNEGRNRDDVLALVPKQPKSMPLRLLDVYRENIEDVYSYPELSVYTMTVFRSEVCHREIQQARTLPRLAGVRDKLGQCQVAHGLVRSTALFQCVSRVVYSI